MSVVSFLLKCLHSILLPSLYIISLNKKSHSRLPLSKKKAFSQMELHGSQKALLCPSCWPGLLCSLTYIPPLPEKEVDFFFPSWQLLGRFTIVFWESSFSKAIVKTVVNRTFSIRMRGTGSKAGSICQEWMWPLPHSALDGTAAHPSCWI